VIKQSQRRRIGRWFNVPVLPIYTSRIIGVLFLFDDI